MKRYVILLLVFIFFVVPKRVSATNEGYEVVTKLPKEDIVLYAKKMNDGLYRDFKLDFKGETYFRPLWINVTNPTYAPDLFYEDINKDGTKELIITRTSITSIAA